MKRGVVMKAERGAEPVAVLSEYTHKNPHIFSSANLKHQSD